MSKITKYAIEESFIGLSKKSIFLKILTFALKKKFINGTNKEIENNSINKANTKKKEKIKNFFFSD